MMFASRLLDRLPSLKLRLSIIILAGVGCAVAAVTIGRGLGVHWFPAAAAAGVVSLGLVQLVAKGTTYRLRELASAAEMFASGHHDHRVAVTSNDEVGQLSSSFNSMADELEAVDRFRRDLVANASHELRTPIAASRAVLENMVDGVQDANPETLRPVLDQVVRLGRLVDQLFDLSTLESGAVPMAHQKVDLRAIADSVAESAAMRSGESPVLVDADASGRSGAADMSVTGDPERLHQVLTNLVDNALRYASTGGEPVRITLVSTHDSVELRVIDRGPGIPQGLRSRVFDRFVRGDASRSSADGGAGLGLSIVKSIVDAHHGAIWIEDPIRAHTTTGSGPPAGSGSPPGCCVVVKLPR
jgi:signal transduction histidine kinase